MPFLGSYPGRTAAALAAHSANATEHYSPSTLAFPGTVHRVRSEDVAGDPAENTGNAQATLRRDAAGQAGPRNSRREFPEPLRADLNSQCQPA
jgi:hypothetical protein